MIIHQIISMCTLICSIDFKVYQNIIQSLGLFFFFSFSLWVLYLHVSLDTTYISDAHRGLKMTLDLLELELQMVVKVHMDAGIEPKSSGRIACALSY